MIVSPDGWYTQNVSNGLTLTETAYWSRRIIAGTGLLLVLFILAKIGLNFRQKQIALQTPPPKIEKPTLVFGKLPKLKFSDVKSNRPLSYELQTATGTISPTPPIAKIFLMPKPTGITFFSLDKGKAFAARLGFSGEPEELATGQYRWSSEIDIPGAPGKKAGKTLAMNVVSGNFRLSYDLGADPGVLEGNLPAESEAAKIATEFLRNLNLYPPDLAGGEKQISYLRFQGGQMLPTLSKSDANLAQVSFRRQGIKDALLGSGASQGSITPAAPPKYNQAQVQVILSTAKEEVRRIVEVNYVFWAVDYQNFATYPIVSGQQAYTELTNNAGVIVSGGDQNKAIIRRVFLAYYDPLEHQDFFQPIFVFEGDNSFVAYVPALDKAWIEAGKSTGSQ